MKKSKFLISIENLNEVEEYKKIGYSNFLFAIEEFSIGYKSYSLDILSKLDCNKYLLINRILNTSDVDKIKGLIPDLSKFKGIIFEDIAIYNILKNYDIELIWNQTHFATNKSSINNWLEITDSIVVSNELTFSEVKDIINDSIKPVILNVFGKNTVMYSRRTLLSNFNEYFGLDNISSAIIRENITNNEFLVKETDKGTIYFNNTYFNIMPYIKDLNDDNIKFYLIYPNGLNVNTIDNVINTGKYDEEDDGFMNRKTIYKLGEKK